MEGFSPIDWSATAKLAEQRRLYWLGVIERQGLLDQYTIVVEKLQEGNPLMGYSLFVVPKTRSKAEQIAREKKAHDRGKHVSRHERRLQRGMRNTGPEGR